MQLLPKSVQNLIDEFSNLPGVGPRTAERLTFYLLKTDFKDIESFGRAILELKSGIKQCAQCFNLTDQKFCDICEASDRLKKVIAVVEEPLDVVAIEKTGLYKGLYHVLGGVISPIDGIGPEDLQVDSLLKRIKDQQIKEIILATNPSTEGETTAMYIKRRLDNYQGKITRLARGLPVGGDLEYADQITLGRALQGRQLF